MLRLANIIDILGAVFMTIMHAVLLGILTLRVINFVRAVTRRGAIALQGLAAIVIWVVFSYALMLILATVTWTIPSLPS